MFNYNYIFLFGLILTTGNALHEEKRELRDVAKHGEPQIVDVPEIFDIFDDEGQRGLASPTYNNIRMHAYYDSLTQASADYKAYLQTQLVPAVLAYFEGALKIKYPVSGLLKLSSTVKSVCGIPIPSILKTGVNADYFIMFESALDKEGSWVAESFTCSLSSTTKRPLVAKATFNENLLKNPGDNVLLHEKNIYLLLHEVTHTLGFSSNLYKYYLMPDGKVRTGHILTMPTALGNATVVNVPAITDRLRSFFGCPTLAGAYMENTGSSATAGSHFERRMFPFEAMTSGLIYQLAYSEFSLAMLESTGWYVPDYSYADPYWFGQGEGCEFLTGSCESSLFTFEDFCKGSARGCTVVGRGGGNCGSDTRADGCRFVRPNVDLDCDNPNYSAPRLESIQTFGRDAQSKCFMGTLSSTSSTAANTNFCFKYKCVGSGSSTKLEVTVGTKAIVCSKAGDVSVSGYKGKMTCPDPLTFCSTVGKASCPRNCMGRGSCVNGNCQCKAGFKGKDCGITA